MLAAYGCRVETIDDPLGARDVILAAQEKGKPFETIIIDHMMPGMDGVQLAAQLQDDAEVKPVKTHSLVFRHCHGKPGRGMGL